MNLTNPKYKDFALVREMLETPDVIRQFDRRQSGEAIEAIRAAGKLLLTGEGSSRIFPAKNAITEWMRLGAPIAVQAEGSRQAHAYDLTGSVVFGASNSGQTKEVISLFNKLKNEGHSQCYGLTAHDGTKLESLSRKAYVLNCGNEDAVAATKSVAEQALFYLSLVSGFDESTASLLDANLEKAADAARKTLETELPEDMVQSIANAPVIYFAGRNDGAAEELALKTNEITRKKSDYLEGTYAVHGIEEVMNADEVVIVVDPYPEEVEKFKEVLADGVGMKIIAIASEDTIFPTIRIPSVPGYDTILQLLAGWNVLVHVGVALGIDLDKPERARKVGNEFVE